MNQDRLPEEPFDQSPSETIEQTVNVDGSDNVTVVAANDAHVTIQNDTYYMSGVTDPVGSGASLDRGEYLLRLREASRSRREIRRTGVGLTAEQVDRSLKMPVGVPAELIAEFPTGQMRALIGPLGSGKSDIAEQWHLGIIDEAEANENARVPVWVSVRDVTTTLQDLVLTQLREDSELERMGADVVVDGLDERTETAPQIIQLAAGFVSRWPKSRILLTSRSREGIPQRQRVDVPSLSDFEATRLMQAVAGGPVGRLNDALAEAVQRPLFALLVARHASAASGVTGVPELIDLVVDEVVTRVGYDLYEQLQRLAVETIRGGRPVNPERFTTPDVAARIRASPIVSVNDRTCAFSLATFEQWFAAKALLHGAVSVEDILVSLRTFDRWKYVLALVLAAGEPERADPVIAAVARWNPGALSWLIRESRTGGLSRHRPDFGPEDWETIGYRLRDVAVAMLEGLGPLAAATYPVKIGGSPDLSTITVAVGSGSTKLALAWLVSDEDPEEPLGPVAALPLRSVERSIYLRIELLTTGVNWVWEVMQRHLASDLDGSLDATVRQLAAQAEGVVRAEALEEARLSRAAWSFPSDEPADSVAPLYPLPDRPRSYQEPWGYYSPETMRQRVQQVIEATLRCYRQLCETLVPRFGDTLGHRALMPVQFYGNVGYNPDREKSGISYPGPSEPGLSWLLKPLGTPTPDGRRHGSDRVSLTLNDENRAKEIRDDDRDTLYRSYADYFEAQPALEPFRPNFSRHSGRYDILAQHPATNLALKWLREDLKKLGWLAR
ncbi:hypothetical protein [Nocardia salmonicida]|uniref:hypothetical protein n=1 Tax=Nocardia salmonicida TaxID=53431 RepID=UPI003CE8F65D